MLGKEAAEALPHLASGLQIEHAIARSFSGSLEMLYASSLTDVIHADLSDEIFPAAGQYYSICLFFITLFSGQGHTDTMRIRSLCIQWS